MSNPLDSQLAALQVNVDALLAQYNAAESDNADLRTQLASASDQITALTATNGTQAAQIQALEQQVSVLTPKPPQLGVYAGGPADDDTIKSTFGRYPDIASTYVQGNGVTAKWIAAETARIKKGISPLITITSAPGKGAPAAVNPATIAAQTPAAVAWVDAYVTALATLSEVDPDIEIKATIDHEPEVGHNQGVYPGITMQQFAASLCYFISRCRILAPKVKTVAWFGEADTTDIAAILGAMTWAPDYITLDPYDTDAHPAGETFEQTVAPHVAWLRGNVDYIRLGSPPIGLTELGVGTKHGDKIAAAWLTDLRTHLANLHLPFGVFFDRPNPDYLIDPKTFPLSVAAMSASLAGAAS